MTALLQPDFLRYIVFEQWGPPVEADGEKLRSVFDKFPDKELVSKPGLNSSDMKSWDEVSLSGVFFANTYIINPTRHLLDHYSMQHNPVKKGEFF